MNDNDTHYLKKGHTECKYEMMKIFGVEQYKSFCLLNAYKYAYRRGAKQGEIISENTRKIKYYINEYLKFDGDSKNLIEIYKLLSENNF